MGDHDGRHTHTRRRTWSEPPPRLSVTYPVTVSHPSGLFRAGRGKAHVGHVSGDARQDGDQTLADVVIQDAAAIADVEARRLSDLSPGYTVELDHTPGVTPAGERYDVRRTRIVYDHIALLPPGGGRQGRTVALRLDGAGNQISDRNDNMGTNQAEDQVEQVKKRAKLMVVAQEALGKEFSESLFQKSDREVQAAVIGKFKKEFKDGAHLTDEYVAAMFDAMTDLHRLGAGARTDAALIEFYSKPAPFGDGGQDAVAARMGAGPKLDADDVSNPTLAWARMHVRNLDAWKTPLTDWRSPLAVDRSAEDSPRSDEGEPDPTGARMRALNAEAWKTPLIAKPE